jgi:hypothetical protein
MTPITLALLALPLTSLVACSGAQVPGQRSPDCALEFLRKPPERPHEVLGTILEHVMNVPPGGPLEAVRPKACAMGADAFVVEREQVLNYFGHVLVEGKAIRWTVAPPAAPEARAPEAAPPAPSPGAAPEPKPAP